MANKKCFRCQKEITTGKFYSFYVGKKGGKRIIEYSLDKKIHNFYCPTCFSKEKTSPSAGIESEKLLEIEWEVGNQTDEEILEFEKKWESFYLKNELIKYDENTGEKKILAWCQKVKRELEPFLQKPAVVEKSFGGKLGGGYGKRAMSFYYLFPQSAHSENYRKTVAEPTIAEIFGVNKLENEINTTITGNGPGVPGQADGNFKIGSQHQVNYSWIDGPQGGTFRRICFEVFDQKWTLQSFCRALEIKEKELTSQNPEIEVNNHQATHLIKLDDKGKPKTVNTDADSSSKNSHSNNSTNWPLITGFLVFGGAIVIFGLLFFWVAKNNK